MLVGVGWAVLTLSLINSDNRYNHLLNASRRVGQKRVQGSHKRPIETNS